MKSQGQEAATIADQAARIEERKRGIERLKADLPKQIGVNVGYLDMLNANYAELSRLQEDLNGAKAKLAQLEATHTQHLTNTVAARTIEVKNTGLVYEGLQVWRCTERRGPEQ